MRAYLRAYGMRVADDALLNVSFHSDGACYSDGAPRKPHSPALPPTASSGKPVGRQTRQNTPHFSERLPALELACCAEARPHRRSQRATANLLRSHRPTHPSAESLRASVFTTYVGNGNSLCRRWVRPNARTAIPQLLSVDFTDAGFSYCQLNAVCRADAASSRLIGYVGSDYDATTEASDGICIELASRFLD